MPQGDDVVNPVGRDGGTARTACRRQPHRSNPGRSRCRREPGRSPAAGPSTALREAVELFPDHGGRYNAPNRKGRVMKLLLLLSAASALTCFCMPACQSSSRNSTAQEAISPARPGRHAGLEIPPGKLGHPLRTYLTIEGARWDTANVKTAGAKTLLVDTVNGKKLSSPVPVDLENLQDPGLPKGERCVLRGHETGRMIGVPDEVARAEHILRPQAGWQFWRTFVVASVVSPNIVKIKPIRRAK